MLGTNSRFSLCENKFKYQPFVYIQNGIRMRLSFQFDEVSPVIVINIFRRYIF